MIRLKTKPPEIWNHSLVSGRVIELVQQRGRRYLCVLHPTSPHFVHRGMYEYPDPLPALEVGAEVTLHTAIESPSRLFVVELITSTAPNTETVPNEPHI